MLRNLIKPPSIVSNLNVKVKFPEKLKGTIAEKWANYWKNLVIDYKQMLQDLRTDIQDEPRKAFKWTAVLLTMYVLAKNNPDHSDFKDCLRRIDNEMGLVSEPCRNPVSVNHLSFLDTNYNQDVLHYTNLGLFSIIYTSELNEACDLYKTQCKYVQPTYLSFPKRIVDVGIMGRWWNIYIKTTNYDVNEESITSKDYQ